MVNKVRCKKCGGRLVYEELFQRGRVYNVLPDGTIGKRFKYMSMMRDKVRFWTARPTDEQRKAAAWE